MKLFRCLAQAFNFHVILLYSHVRAAILLCAHLWQYSIVYFHFYFFSWDREWYLILEGLDSIEQIDLRGIFNAPLCVNMVLQYTGETNPLSR